PKENTLALPGWIVLHKDLGFHFACRIGVLFNRTAKTGLLCSKIREGWIGFTDRSQDQLDLAGAGKQEFALFRWKRETPEVGRIIEFEFRGIHKFFGELER